MSTNPYEQLKSRIENRSALAAVIGLGYVGLPLAKHLCDAGCKVIGFDVDPKKTEALNAGKSYIRHVDAQWIQETVSARKFEATTDFSRLSEADCISICVPTPVDAHQAPDLQHVVATTEQIQRALRPGQLVILESTTYPGTTAEVLLPKLSETGLRVGEDFFLVFSPEREDPGNPTYSIRNIPKVMGGVTPKCVELATLFYGIIFERVVRVSSPAVAEFSKLLENIFRSVNIALVNELKMLCDRMGIDVWEVIDAAATKPFGFMPFYPGPGLGGHCIPIDPFYLSWKAREYDSTTQFVELAGQINTGMPKYVVNKTMEALNERGKPTKGSRILLLGAAYKKDVDDIRESPSIRLIQLFRELGAHVDYNDPYIPEIKPGRHHSIIMTSVALTEGNLRGYDCVLISTAHSCYDIDFIVENAQLVVDTRNATVRLTKNRHKVVKA